MTKGLLNGYLGTIVTWMFDFSTNVHVFLSNIELR